MLRVLGVPRLIACVVAVLLMATGLQVGLVAVGAPTASAAGTAATGTGGMFVPAQGRLLDTRYGTGGYTTLSGGQWNDITVGGALDVPTSEVSAVMISLTVVTPSAAGSIKLEPGGSGTAFTPVTFAAAGVGTVSNTAAVALGSGGDFKVESTVATDLIIDLQGYYTAGSATAAGGYVPVNTARIADSRIGTQLSSPVNAGTTSTVQVSGHGGVPANASAVFAIFTVINPNNAGDSLIPYAADQPRPNVTLHFFNSQTTALSATVPLSSTGAIDLYNYGTNVDMTIDVIGYFTGGATQASSGAFTPATAAFSVMSVPANGSVTRQIAGVAGVPVAGSGLSAVAVNVQVAHPGTLTGVVGVSTDQSNAAVTSVVHYASAETLSNFMAARLGPDGVLKIVNTGNDPVTVTVAVEGWYTSLSDRVVVNGQNLTQHSVDLQAQPQGTTGVIYAYRVDTTATFTQVPTGDLTDTNGGHPSFPMAPSGSGTSASFTPYTWKLANTLGSSTDTGTLVQVEACYGTSLTDPNLVCTMPNDITYAPGDFGDANATTDLGPGTLSLLTGDYQVSATDAAAATSLGGLSIGRSLTTLAPAAANATATGVFGPGWSADLAGPEAGEGDLTVTDNSAKGYLTFTAPDGWSAIYQATSPITTPATYPISFAATGDNAGDGSTVTMASASKITMADADGTVTTWTKPASTWQATSVEEPGSNTTTTYVHSTAGTTAGLVTRILAPTPAGLSPTCTDTNADTTPGCRSLILNYTTVGGASRLTSVQASLPQTNGTPNKTTIAAYDYDTTGRLLDAYDPRISPHLVTAYTYNSDGRLATLTEPGLNPWSFAYDNKGRLSTVSRDTPVTDPATGDSSKQTAVSTIVYGLPNSGTTGLPDLSATAAATWDETTDLPIDETATAIFSPDHQPAATTLSGVGTGDWPYATIHYLDVDGREVNTASYGAGDWQIDTSQYDANGNDIWDLSAGNRAQALNPTTATDSYAASQGTSAARANLLASATVYNPLDPSEVTDTYGPTHPVTLSSGNVVHARTHSSTVYDEGAPNSDVDPQTGAAYRLPTTVTTDPYDLGANSGAGADSTYPDANTTHLGYAATGSMSSNLPSVTDLNGNTVAFNGWNLGAATTSTIQMDATPSTADDLTTTTVYDTDGRTVATWLPGDSTGTTPRATNTTYYTATGSGTCTSAASAGLVCQTAPGGQPGTGAPLPTTTTTYDQWGDPLTTTQTYGSTGTSRTVTNTYDAAGRLLTSATAVAGAPSDNTDLPKITNTYDPDTGLPTTSSTGTGTSTQTLTTGYNKVGAVTSYADTTGSTPTTTGYDIDDRAVLRADGRGTSTVTYDPITGLVTSEDITNTGQPAGQSGFSASYDAAGDLIAETYPGGITATSRYDNAGNQTSLDYATSTGAKLLSFTQTQGSTGTGVDHVVAQSSTVNDSAYSDQNLTEDAAGRLTTVKDNLSATGMGSPSGCTTRQYVFDTHSNRTKLTSYAPAGDGSCSTTSTVSVTNYSYDAADRLTGGTNGTETYDVLGRASQLPAGETVGIGSHNPANGGPSGNLTLGYYSNDMVATQAQGNGTSATDIAFALDPDQNRVNTEATTTAAGVKKLTNHYDDDTDSPAWTNTMKVDGTTVVKRYLSGIDGGLDATVTDSGSGPLLKLDLTNLHGDTVASIDPSATSITGYHETTEYGLPRDPTTAADDYGYLGAQMRATDDLGGLTIMGARLYNPVTGRFLSTDSLRTGSANAYAYPTNPTTSADPSGMYWVDSGWHMILDETHTSDWEYLAGNRWMNTEMDVQGKSKWYITENRWYKETYSGERTLIKIHYHELIWMWTRVRYRSWFSTEVRPWERAKNYVEEKWWWKYA